MHKIHKQLTDKAPWYKAWHCNRHSSYLHWFVFLLAAELVFFAFNNMADSLRRETSMGGQVLVRTRSVFAENSAPNPDEPGALTIAIKDFATLKDAARGRSIPAKIYYPTSPGARYPLIILSHGAGGNRNGYAYIGEHLANHGYIVAAPNHVGSDSARVAQLMASGMTNLEAVEYIALDQSEWQARAQDVTFLINQASVWDISDPDLMGRFDLARVGVIGHSYGAKTALSAAGALQNFSSGMTNLGDPRVDAIVPLSPPCMDPSTGVEDLGEFTNVSFSNVTVPAFGMSGTKDICFYNSGLPKWRKGSYDLMPFGEKYFTVLENAGHLDFTTADLPDGTEAETNRIARAMTLVFFNVILKNDTASKTAYLNEAYMDSLTGSAIPNIQWFSPVGITANPTNGMAPLVVAFAPTVSDQNVIIASYIWDFGDGGTASVANPTHTYNAAGTYTAKVTVTDNGGATAGASVTITVNPSSDTTPPTASVTAPLNGATVGAKSTVTITATATDNVGVAQVQFFINGALLSTDATSPYSAKWKVPAARGKTYQIQAVATDKAGNAGRSAIIKVTAK